MAEKNIVLDYDCDVGSILIDDQSGLVSSSRRVKFQIKQAFGVMPEGKQFSLPVSADQEEISLRKLVGIFDFLKVEVEIKGGAKGLLRKYQEEKMAFDDFSSKARSIWEGELESRDLQAFTNTLNRAWPTRKLYPLQLLSAFHLAFSQNACNFSVPGAGKTSTVLAAFAYLFALPEENPKHTNKLLVVGPLSCFKPWEDEFEACFGRKPNSFRISGEVAKDSIDFALSSLSAGPEKIELILISYQSLSNYLERIKSLLDRSKNKFMVILDEAHRAKNTEGGLWAESVLSLAPHASARVVLTGTPAPNGFQDLYNLFKFIWPEKNVLGFLPGHLKAMTDNRYDVRRSRVVDNAAPFFVRISKKDLALPEPDDRHETVVRMGPIQRAVYDYIENGYINFLKKEGVSSPSIFAKAKQIRLLQAATNPSLLTEPLELEFEAGTAGAGFVDDAQIFSMIANYHRKETPAKFKKALEIIKESLDRGEKVIIWAYYVGNIIGFQDYLHENGISSKLLYGAVEPSSDDENVETRETIIEEFHNPASSFRVIIANPYAVGESISLHKACHHAIYLERNFNASVFLQSKDRIHRYGMLEGTTARYDYILCEDSVDETVHRRLNEKTSLMMEVVESRDIPLLNLAMESPDSDIEDIQSILSDYKNRVFG